ncbi:hypothetical protein B7992_07845 [Fibrobacter sp. UWH1]|nr:hypothetical protein B7992_07845 [Fibrobacter sp. UWH1]
MILKNIAKMVLTTMIAANILACNSEVEHKETAVLKHTERVMKLENVANVRELGGIKTSNGKQVKSNVLFRSANLAKASENDVKFLQGLNLKLICDLRTEQERENNLDVEISGAQNIWFNVLGALPQKTSSVKQTEAGVKIGKAMNPNTFNEEAAAHLADFVQTGVFDSVMENLYVGLVAKEHAQQEYSRMFDSILATQGGTILWHCSQGKDRAGLASVFILSALGVDSTSIMEDFAKSNESYQTMVDVALKVAQDKGLSKEHQGVIQAMLGVNPSYMKRALDYINANFGSMEDYMEQKIGLTAEKRELLRSFYLE